MKLGFWLVLLALAATHPAAADEPRVLQVLEDFESGGRLSNQRIPGLTFDTTGEPASGQHSLKITVARDFTWRWSGWDGRQDQPLTTLRVATLASPYLPPEADAIRLRVRVLSGRLIIAPGGPVSQIGNSDVFCDPQEVTATDGWTTCTFSLNHRLMRNFRRPNFTVDLPVIYYTRWIQEPVYLQLIAPRTPVGEETVVLIDQVELIATGEGQPFPHFAPGQLTARAPVVDFATAAGWTNLFSLAHGYSILKPFAFGYHRQPEANARPTPAHILKSSPFIPEEGTLYPAPRFSRVTNEQGRTVLHAEGIWAEEGQIITHQAHAPASANALTVTLKPDFPNAASGTYASTYVGQRTHAVDFVIWVAPPDRTFPWSSLTASAALQEAARTNGYTGPGAKYDFLLTPEPTPFRAQPDLRKAGPFAFYVARRYVPAGAWSTAVIPFADFICVYGQDTCRDLQTEQRPLSADLVAGIGYLMPFGSGHGTLEVEQAGFAAVPGTPADLRSFWQEPDLTAVQRTPLPRFDANRPWALMTTDGTVPDFLK